PVRVRDRSCSRSQGIRHGNPALGQLGQQTQLGQSAFPVLLLVDPAEIAASPSIHETEIRVDGAFVERLDGRDIDAEFSAEGPGFREAQVRETSHDGGGSTPFNGPARARNGITVGRLASSVRGAHGAGGVKEGYAPCDPPFGWVSLFKSSPT